MSSFWEEFENQSALHTHKVVQEVKPRNDGIIKAKCPICDHEVSTSKTTNIMCYRCRKRFDLNSKTRLSIQEVPDVLVKQNEIQIGRFCKCGCGNSIPLDARKDRLFFKSTCRRNYLNRTFGYTESRNVFRARIRIKHPRAVLIYPSKGQIFKIPITEECEELWAFCNEMQVRRA